MENPLGDNLILVIDAGTQSMRCGLVDLTGQFVDLVKIPIQPYYSTEPDFAEQDPEYYWEKLCNASQKLISNNQGRLDQISAVALTSHRGTYLNLDDQGKPLRPAITWLDRRKIPTTKWAPWYLEAAFKGAGVFSYLDNLYRHAYPNWIRYYQPLIWEKTDKFVLLSAYLNFKLTNILAESLGSNYGYLPINRRTFQWADQRDSIWTLFPIERNKLPNLVAQGAVIGTITKSASEQTGIPLEVPIIATACDKSCEVLGAGCLDSSIASLSFGTLATVNTMTDQYVELKPFLTPYPGALPNHFVTEIPVVRGFWMVSWFLSEFGTKEQQLAEKMDVSPESLLDELIEQIPPGSDGLILQPYWNPFRINSGDEGRGSIIGFTDLHTRAHLYKAILEGLAYALKEGTEITAAKMNTPFRKLRVSGGGAMSKAALQITADVFNMPVERPSTNETSALGAAIIAAVSQKFYNDYSSAVQGMTGIAETINPIQKNAEIYSNLYKKVYKKMYSRLKPLFMEIADLKNKFPEEMS